MAINNIFLSCQSPRTNTDKGFVIIEKLIYEIFCKIKIFFLSSIKYSKKSNNQKTPQIGFHLNIFNKTFLKRITILIYKNIFQVRLRNEACYESVFHPT